MLPVICYKGVSCPVHIHTADASRRHGSPYMLMRQLPIQSPKGSQKADVCTGSHIYIYYLFTEEN